MGQQQLLLVILVTIIVGIATVVAINTFGSAADAANVDAVRQDLTQISASAQSYYMKPEMLGGGGRDFTGITFNDISFGADSLTNSDLTAHNSNGDVELGTVAADNIILEATPSSGGGLQARICENNMVMGDYDPEAANGAAATAPGACP